MTLITNNKKSLTALAMVCIAGLLSGCLDRDLAVLEPKVSRVINLPVGNDGIADVDLLLVIDDSRSMAQEQELLREQIPALVRDLTSPPDQDGDGEPDWEPVESLRVAVVTTDMGTAGYDPQTSVNLGCGVTGTTGHVDGRDGAFVVKDTCGSTDGIQVWETGDDAEAFANEVGCVADVGTSGCGFEQPLSAAARSLSRREETGFPRDEALLAILVLTDEEDCSLSDAEGFFTTLGTNTTAMNQHCAFNQQYVDDVDGLMEQLTAGRDPSSSRFLFAAIAGIPTDMVEAAPRDLLAAEEMQYTANDTLVGLEYACTRSEGGEDRSLATPGRRYVEIADRVPNALVRSICEESFQPAIEQLTRNIGQRLTGACLDRALTPDESGRVDCVVEETLPHGMRCDELPGRMQIGETSDGREECEVDQVPNAEGPGWYYDLTDLTCDRVNFTEDALPALGSRVRFECLVEVETPHTPENATGF